MKKKGIATLSVLSALVLSLMTFTSSAFAAEGTPEVENVDITQSTTTDIESTTAPVEEASTEAVETDDDSTEVTTEADVETTDTSENSVENDDSATENDDELDDFLNEYADDVAAFQDSLLTLDPEKVYEGMVDSSDLEDVAGTYILDHSESDYDGLLYLIGQYDYEDGAELLPIPSGKTILTKFDNIEVAIPTDNFTSIAYMMAILKDAETSPEALSTLYDFYFIEMTEYDNAAFVHQFNNAITLKFVIDSSKVKNWNDVKVIYINNQGEQEEIITPKEIKHLDNNLAEITVEVTHFSKYGVFEIPGSGDTDNSNDDNSSDNGGNTNNNNSDNGNNANADTNNGSTTNVAKTNNSTANIAKAATTVNANNELPNTATNTYNTLLFGAALLALGALFSFRKNAKC